jgi:hypothetical protein
MINLLRFLLFIIEYNAVAILTFSIFRVIQHRRDNQIKLFIVATIMSIIAYYLFDIAKMKELVMYFIPVYMIIATCVVFHFPFIYATILGLVFTLIGFSAEYTMGSLAQITGIMNYVGIDHSIYAIAIIQTVVSSILLLIAYLISITKWGFMFRKPDMSGRRAYSLYNIIFGTVLVIIFCAIAIGHFTAQNAPDHFFHPIIFFSINAALIISLVIAWMKQKKSITTAYTSQYSLKIFEKRKK